MDEHNKKQTRLRRLFDFWSFENITIISILKILQFFRNLGAKAESAGWRKVCGIFVRNEYSKFILAAFRLKYAEQKPESLDEAKSILFRRLQDFIRKQPELNWAVDVQKFLFKRKRIHVCDIMEVETDHSGNIRNIIPHFDKNVPVAHFLPPQISFILRHIAVVYNTMRYERAEDRTERIEHALKVWVAANSGYDFMVRLRLANLIDRIMSSVFIFCEVQPGVSDGKTPRRFHSPDLRKIRHPGWGMLCISARFSEDLNEVDLWWQFSHVTADGAPMQEIMNRLKSKWGTAGEFAYPALNDVLSVPDIVYCGDKVFRARLYIDFSELQKIRKRINQMSEITKNGLATIAEIILWGISAHPFFADKKFLVPVDRGEQNGERELSLLVIRPGKYRIEENNQISAFVKFHEAFFNKLKDIREGRGESDEFLQLCTMLHPFFYRAAKVMAPTSLQEILGTIGFSVIRDADLFVSPLTDFQINGFLSLGNLSVPTANGKKAGSLCICGKKDRIRLHLEAISLFFNAPDQFFDDTPIKKLTSAEKTKKNLPRHGNTRTFQKKTGLFL